MYHLPRQFQLLESINWNVVRAKVTDRKRMADLIQVCKAHLDWPDVFTNSDRTAAAFVDFCSLAQLVADVGELPFQQNKWLLPISINLLYWFGPEDEILALVAA